MNVLLGIFGTIGLWLILAPFIGLIYDLKKSRKYLEAIIFLALCFLVICISTSIKSLEIATIFSFSLVPALFLAIFISGKTNSKKRKSNWREAA